MERVVQFLTEFHDARYDQYEEFVRAGQIEGVFRPDVDPGTLAHMIDALISGFIYRASFNPRSATPEALLACFELVFQRILGFEYQTRPSNEEDDG
jgi:hypothetical protein